jgi:putative DNA primase/helicase
MSAIDMGEAEDDFRAKLAEAGLVVSDGIVGDGQIKRIDVEGKPGKKDGWYSYHPDGIVPHGAYGDWHDPDGWKKWSARNPKSLPAADRAVYLASLKEEQKQQDDLRKQVEAEKARLAAWIWGKAPLVTAHGYLTKKNVKSHGLRLNRDGRLIVPAYNSDGHISTLQFIDFVDGEGVKRFLKGGKKAGCWFPIGELTETICICEGYATGASVHAATTHHTIVAFDAHNLTAVAKAIRAKHPEAKIILCADDDGPANGNPGLSAATRAAHAVRGLLAVPRFEKRIPC